MTASTSPVLSVNETSVSAFTPGKRLETPRTSSRGVGMDRVVSGQWLGRNSLPDHYPLTTNHKPLPHFLAVLSRKSAQNSSTFDLTIFRAGMSRNLPVGD